MRKQRPGHLPGVATPGSVSLIRWGLAELVHEAAYLVFRIPSNLFLKPLIPLKGAKNDIHIYL